MSTVRMCDESTCGLIFSENEEGWASAAVTRRIFNSRTGEVESVTVQEDRCPTHAGGTHRPVPQVAIEGLPNVQQ